MSGHIYPLVVCSSVGVSGMGSLQQQPEFLIFLTRGGHFCSSSRPLVSPQNPPATASELLREDESN